MLGNIMSTWGACVLETAPYFFLLLFGISPSMLRRKLQSVADPKYGGVKTTRQRIMEDSDGMQSEEEVSNEESEVEDDQEMEKGNSPAQSESENDGKDQEHAKEPHTDLTSQKRHSDDGEPTDELSTALQNKRDEDRTKGKAVSRQIVCSPSLR